MNEESEKTQSDEIWDEIKNLPLDAYALPNQKVHNHVTRLIGGPNTEVYLRLKSSGIIISLEAILSAKYDVLQNDEYTVVRRKLPVHQFVEADD